MKPEIEYVYNKLKQLRFDFKESDRKLFPNEYTFDYSLDRYVRVDGNDLYISKDTFKPLEEELEYADNCHKLEEELGCPLDVLVKMWKNHKYYALKPRGRTRVRQMDFPVISYILKGNKGNKSPYKSNSFILGGTCYDYDCFDEKTREFDGWDVNLADYKKTWWLREDKSE